jgi:hypothetical protein
MPTHTKEQRLARKTRIRAERDQARAELQAAYQERCTSLQQGFAYAMAAEPPYEHVKALMVKYEHDKARLLNELGEDDKQIRRDAERRIIGWVRERRREAGLRVRGPCMEPADPDYKPALPPSRGPLMEPDDSDYVPPRRQGSALRCKHGRLLKGVGCYICDAPKDDGTPWQLYSNVNTGIARPPPYDLAADPYYDPDFKG